MRLSAAALLAAAVTAAVEPPAQVLQHPITGERVRLAAEVPLRPPPGYEPATHQARWEARQRAAGFTKVVAPEDDAAALQAIRERDAGLARLAAAEAVPWPEAERLFHQDPSWLGSDAAYSIPLGDGRTLWLFGDTFVARAPGGTRRESVMVRNTVAVQHGPDPRSAKMEFAWGRRGDGSPAAFFPDEGGRGYWPGHGLRVEHGPLVVFLYAVVNTPGVGLGFAGDGWSLAVVQHPERPPAEWAPRIIRQQVPAWGAVPSTAVVLQGEWVVCLAIGQEASHAGMLVRWPLAALAAGETRGAEWWTGPVRGWVPQADVGPGGPAVVMDDAGSECSIHRDPQVRQWVHTSTLGFGATSVGIRTAPELTGPWSPPVVIHRPRESQGEHPFVYAAKAHPELTAPQAGALVITYATNSFTFADLFTDRGQAELYWPRVVVLPAPAPATAGADPGVRSPAAPPPPAATR
ncbi:MAG: DUF4185 domain-containing protein [Phycisphaerales bacterium]